jgi:hypothetical protein
MIREGVMQLGDWELTLRPDTPREVRDKIVGHSTLVVTPGRLDVSDIDDDILDFALFSGVVTRPGPYLSIGGHGLALYMGTGDRHYTVASDGSSLPELHIVNGGVGVTLSTHLNAIFSNSEIGLTVGTVTDPTSGSQTIAHTVAWVSVREELDAHCKEFEVEWRVYSNGVVDIGPHTTLYDTPTVIVTPQPGGRDIGYRGIEALVNRQIDLFEYANRVYVRGRTNYAVAGSVPVQEPYRGFNGEGLWVTVVVDSPDMSANVETFAATRMLSTFSAPRQSVTVTSEEYDFTGDIVAGSRIYVWDPDSGVGSVSSGTAIDWRGETIYPLTFRVTSKRWSVRDGMGVYIRRFTGNFTAGVPGDLEYVDLSDYVEWETGATEYEVTYDINLNWRRP